MQEKTDELYQEYLEKRLDIIFDSNSKTGIKYKNNLYAGITIIKKDGKYNFTDGNDNLLCETGYDYIFYFINGFAVVEKEGKYNFINDNYQLISKTWYDSVVNFNENGFARVGKDGKYNYIDRNGKLVSDTWFGKKSFSVVEENSSYACVDKNGNNLNKVLFDQVYDFRNGFTRVEKKGEWNFVDENGKLISGIWYDDVNDFNEYGYARVKHRGEWNFINKNGKLISKTWYDDAEDFNEYGYAMVMHKGAWNFIDVNGKLISKTWYISVEDFVNGFAQVKKDGKYNLIDTSGNFVSETWYDYVQAFRNGYACVEKDHKYNFIDAKGQLVSETWYDYVYDFRNGFARVKKSGEWNFIDTKRQLISNKWYADADDFNEYGYASVKKDKKYCFINTNGKIISDYVDSYKHWYLRKSFVRIPDESRTIALNKNMNGYQVKKTLLGYRCEQNNDKFVIKYEPIMIYGTKYVLCMSKDVVFIFNRDNNKYNKVGYPSEIVFDDNFIYYNDNGEIYFMYDNQMLDITDYYNRNLFGKKEISITSGVNILSKDDFFYHTEDEIRELLRKEKEEDERKQKEEKKIAEQRKLQEEKDKDEKEKQRAIQEKKDVIWQIQILLGRLKGLEQKAGSFNKIEIDNLFIEVGDHKEINQLYIELGMLKFIDLSMVSFKNVKISGIDFTGCNINFSPQEVYKKDLRNCNFEGLYIPPFMDFRGVDIRGARFSQDNDEKTIDRGSFTFRNAIYDETTTFNGIPFAIIFNEDDMKSGSSNSKK